MPLYEVVLTVDAWVTVEVEAENETDAKEKAIQKGSPNSLECGDFFTGDATIKKILSKRVTPNY